MFFTLTKRGALIVVAIGGLLATVLVVTQPEVTPEETQALRLASSNMIALYNQREFDRIGEALVDDASQGDGRIDIVRKRRIRKGLLSALHDASGSCEASLITYEFGKYRRVPKFQALLKMQCQKRPVEILLTWGQRNESLYLIDLELPNDYYTEVPEIKERLRDIYESRPTGTARQ